MGRGALDVASTFGSCSIVFRRDGRTYCGYQRINTIKRYRNSQPFPTLPQFMYRPQARMTIRRSLSDPLKSRPHTPPLPSSPPRHNNTTAHPAYHKQPHWCLTGQGMYKVLVVSCSCSFCDFGCLLCFLDISITISRPSWSVCVGVEEM